MKLSSGVFERTSGGDTITGASTFYLCLTLSLVWGLVVTGLLADYAINIGFQPNSWLVLILIGLVVPMLGVWIALSSDNPIISFIGYNMIVAPFGFLLGPVVQHYSPNVVKNACYLTGAITLVMGTLGVVFPSFFSRIGGALFAALLGLVVVRIIQIFVPAMQGWGFIEYISAGIFSLYIGYDMWRASEIEKTVDNAIDVSVALYLDILNLFLSILEILGENDD